jgi:hypothetical protein
MRVGTWTVIADAVPLAEPILHLPYLRSLCQDNVLAQTDQLRMACFRGMGGEAAVCFERAPVIMTVLLLARCSNCGVRSRAVSAIDSLLSTDLGAISGLLFETGDGKLVIEQNAELVLEARRRNRDGTS